MRRRSRSCSHGVVGCICVKRPVAWRYDEESSRVAIPVAPRRRCLVCGNTDPHEVVWPINEGFACSPCFDLMRPAGVLVHKEENVAKLSMSEAVRSACNRYGFSEEDVRADPLKASMIDGAARSAVRASHAADTEATIRAIGEELHLDPSVYRDRVKIFNEIARRGLPMAGSQRFTEL